MKLIFRNAIWMFLAVLIIGNVYVFVSGIKLSDHVNHFENQITTLHQENTDLEKKVYEVESLRYTASMAAKLNFIEKPAPLILDNLKYAFNR